MILNYVNRRSLLGAVCICLLSGCGKATAPAEDEKKGPEDVAVEATAASTRTMEEIVEATGNLAPAQGAISKVGPAAQGRIKSVLVKEGDTVSAGQLVAIVENRPQQAMALSSKGAISVADAQAKEAMLAAKASAIDQQNSMALSKLNLEATKLDARNNISQSEIALQAAQTDLQKMRAGARPQEVAQADLAVVQAKATRDRAAAELERVKYLFDKGVDSKRQWEDAQTALAVANSSFEVARLQQSLIKAGNRAEDVRAAEIKVNQARETVAQTKLTGDAKITQAEAALRQSQQSAIQVAVKQQDIVVQRETVRQKRADFEAASAIAGYSEIKSPFSGIVSRRVANEGDNADPANAIVEIVQKNTLNLTAYIPAEDAASVHNGQPVRITSSDTGGEKFSGQVISVGQVDAQTNLLTVRISVVNPKGTLRNGSYAHAEIIVRRIAKAIAVPNEAIISRDGASLAFVLGDDGKAHKTAVTMGIENGGFTEITKGMTVGQKVIILGQFEINDGQKVHVAEKKEGEKKE